MSVWLIFSNSQIGHSFYDICSAFQMTHLDKFLGRVLSIMLNQY